MFLSRRQTWGGISRCHRQKDIQNQKKTCKRFKTFIYVSQYKRLHLCWNEKCPKIRAHLFLPPPPFYPFVRRRRRTSLQSFSGSGSQTEIRRTTLSVVDLSTSSSSNQTFGGLPFCANPICPLSFFLFSGKREEKACHFADWRFSGAAL